ncbi:hypothetical protein HNR62_002259 [Oceanisphaera litoralis]|uniref:hypothetical protein n=1 Tax=Oceanisphaera litoralis TaxID=225144 RepID=UPI001959BAF6|nr:hypothetical protein [Oceanisphaera litoralis]MBM7456373.1 hypothetical protein [Oceanisphaera litoralis]
MAIVKYNDSVQGFLPSDINVLRFIYQRIKFESTESVDVVPFFIDVNQLKIYIEREIGKATKANPFDKLDYLNAAKSYIDSEVQLYKEVHSERLRRVKSACPDDRSCFFFWYRLRTMASLDLNCLVFSLGSVSGNRDRIEQILFLVHYFDARNVMLDGNNPNYFEKIREDWLAVRDKGISIGFLDKNDDVQCGWVWKYISKAMNDDLSLSLPLTLNSTFAMNPSSSEEEFVLSLGFIDISGKHDDTKRRVIEKCSRAWSQKKYRESKKDKVPINTYVSEKAKKILDELVIAHGVSIEIMLEKLILDTKKR